MRIYFNLGYGLICKWFMDGLPKPPTWIRGEMIRHSLKSHIYLGDSDAERDEGRVRVFSGLKKL